MHIKRFIRYLKLPTSIASRIHVTHKIIAISGLVIVSLGFISKDCVPGATEKRIWSGFDNGVTFISGG
jgi:hypothetical protein